MKSKAYQLSFRHAFSMAIFAVVASSASAFQPTTLPSQGYWVFVGGAGNKRYSGGTREEVGTKYAATLRGSNGAVVKGCYGTRTFYTVLDKCYEYRKGYDTCVFIEHNSWVPKDPCGEAYSSVSPGGSIPLTPYICPNGSVWDDDLDACLPVVARHRKTAKDDQCFGNPIVPVVGAKRQSIRLPGVFGIPFYLEYDSRRMQAGPQNAKGYPALIPANLDGLWEANIQRQAFVSDGYVQVYRGAGHFNTFHRSAAGRYASLDSQSNDVALMDGNNLYVFDQSEGLIEKYVKQTGGWQQGFLHTETRRIGGYSLEFFYSSKESEYGQNPQVTLSWIKDPYNGQKTTFEYEWPPSARLQPRLAGVTLPNNRAIAFSYDAEGRLAGVTKPDAASFQFLYESAEHPWALTGVINENGDRSSTFAYDANGLAIETVAGNGANSYRASWSEPPALRVKETNDGSGIYRDISWSAPSGLSVTGPLGKVSNITTVEVNGISRVKSVDQPGGSGCNASTSSMEYDARGNVVSRDDFNGTRTCYAFASDRNVEVTRVEGLPQSQSCAAVLAAGAALPPGARKISTEWHPDWQLPVKVAEPRRITTHVYNGQPDPFASGGTAVCAPADALIPHVSGTQVPTVNLCKTAEQATTDATGAAGFSASLLPGVPPRIQESTYSRSGLVMTKKDPLGNTTTFSYYTYGNAVFSVRDLESIKNPLGQVTKFARYDAAGLPLEIVDGNQVVTYLSYDLAQRLTSSKTSGLTTKYEYWPTGLLKRVTLPDESFVEYQYDVAGRLTAMSDKAGNRVDYELDEAGNRVGEQFKDPTGALARQVSRVTDVLGRVQMRTGW